MNGVIYKITSPTGRIYIGKTTNLRNRINQYKGLRCKSQPALYNSFISHGFENHLIDILGEFSLDILSDKEKYFISFYDSFNNGLNCTTGGDGAFMYGSDNIMSIPEVKEKARQSRINFYKNGGVHWNKGRKRSIETIEKIRVKRIEQDVRQGSPTIKHMLFDSETGIFYDSIEAASNSLGVKYKTFHRRVRYTKQKRYVFVDED
jgi:group I intron endonuclease